MLPWFLELWLLKESHKSVVFTGYLICVLLFF